jgi:hypothetical protein
VVYLCIGGVAANVIMMVLEIPVATQSQLLASQVVTSGPDLAINHFLRLFPLVRFGAPMSTATPTSHHGSPKAVAASGASPSAGARSSAMAASGKRDDGPAQAGRRVWTLADFGDLEHIMRKWVVVIPAMTQSDSSESSPPGRAGPAQGPRHAAYINFERLRLPTSMPVHPTNSILRSAQRLLWRPQPGGAAVFWFLFPFAFVAARREWEARDSRCRGPGIGS